MADYTEEEAERAGKIVDNLLHRDQTRDRFEEGFRWDEKLEEGFSIIDIEAHAAEFLSDWELLRSVDAQFPAMSVAGGPPVPVSLSFLGLGSTPFFGRQPGLFWRSVRHPLWDDYRRELSYAFRSGKRPFGDLPTIPLEAARTSFASRAREFLATRLSNLRGAKGAGKSSPKPPNGLNLLQYAGGPPTLVSGCKFSVSTNSPGLSAYWSGAYYIASNYLGAPTSPAVGVLQAGTYVFGINGGAYGNAVQWDTNAVCSLPGTPSVHLQY